MSVTFVARRNVEEDRWDRIFGTPEVSVSDQNARDLIEYLGLEWEDHGLMDAADLVGRCYLRLAEDRVDPAVPTTTVETAHGGRIFFWGRPKGYLQERTEDLLRVAIFAVDHLGVVAWGQWPQGEDS